MEKAIKIPLLIILWTFAGIILLFGFIFILGMYFEFLGS